MCLVSSLHASFRANRFAQTSLRAAPRAASHIIFLHFPFPYTHTRLRKIVSSSGHIAVDLLRELNERKSKRYLARLPNMIVEVSPPSLPPLSIPPRLRPRPLPEKGSSSAGKVPSRGEGLATSGETRWLIEMGFVGESIAQDQGCHGAAQHVSHAFFSQPRWPSRCGGRNRVSRFAGREELTRGLGQQQACRE